MVLLAHEETNKYARKQGVRGAVQPMSWTVGWGKRMRGETTYLQTAIREHGEEVGTPLPEDLEQRVTEVVVGKGRVYLLEVADAEMHLHIHPKPTDAKTKEVKWWPIAEVLASQWVRKETFNVLEDEVDRDARFRR